jgi:hypothetical protein
VRRIHDQPAGKAIACDDDDRAAKIIQSALGIDDPPPDTALKVVVPLPPAFE